jgi:hypothetical protein
MTTSQTPAWADTTCLLCGAPAEVGHHPDCKGADPNATEYLTEHLPDGTVRSWTMAGVRYSATPARRAAITAAMPTMMWVQAGRRVSLPFMTGLLIKDVVPQLRVGRWLAQVGYHPLATIRVPDCGCADPLRCRCDFDGHPHTTADPDLWADYQLLALRLRRPLGWLDLWLLDIGIGAVVIANDDRDNDPIPQDASRSCQMGWCDLCDGTQPAGRSPASRACAHGCHRDADHSANSTPDNACGGRR